VKEKMGEKIWEGNQAGVQAVAYSINIVRNNENDLTIYNGGRV